MKTIRVGVFETNSSSTHSLTLVNAEDFEKWKRGELLFDKYKQKLVPPPEVTDEILTKYLAIYIKPIENGYLYNNKYFASYEEAVTVAKPTNQELLTMQNSKNMDLYTYQRYQSDIEDVDFFSQEHTTPNGEKVIAFGYFGYN